MTAKSGPHWLKPAAIGATILIAAILLSGILMVPYRASKSPEGYEQTRVHLNTKNSSRFSGADLASVASAISRAVYPATSAETRPEAVILYAPEDWQAGLLATTLLRPLNAVLLPETDDSSSEIERLGARRIIRASSSGQASDELGEVLTPGQIMEMRLSSDNRPSHAVLVNPDDPGTALLAAPWAAFSGDLIVFNLSDVPDGVPVYALGDALRDQGGANRIVIIDGGSSVNTAASFAQFEDPDNPRFGWGMNAESLTGYRAYVLARQDMPAMALLSANLAVRGKPGPLLWAEERRLPQVVNNYLWSQRAAFWMTPAEGPFHHFWVLGDERVISFPAQAQADYSVEIGPYLGKGVGMSGIDLLSVAWVALGIASAGWILFHEHKFLAGQMWVMTLAWPLFALISGPFGILLYFLAYNRPVIGSGKMTVWDRPLWLQGLVATLSAVGFGATLMIVSGWLTTFLGAPLIPSRLPVLFLLGTPMIAIMIINYVIAGVVSWLLFQTPMLSMFYGMAYRDTLSKSLPLVLVSMSAAALAMNPAMWWFMMSKIPMMPTEESILWFGTMFFTGFLAFLMAWPFNYLLVRQHRKSGLM